MNQRRPQPACEDEKPLLLNASLLPLPFDIIPEDVTSLKDCAANQIRALLDRELNDPVSLSSTDEDCLDDGFCLCDLAVPLRKFQAWQHMFPRIAPFYALKCNPDPMVAAVLAQFRTCGFDCASVAELELAQTSMQRCISHSYNSAGNNGRIQEGSRHQEFRIVYANPQRAEKDLETALSMFDPVPPLTFDGPEELYKIHSAYQKQLHRWHTSRQHHQNVDEHNVPPPPPDLILRLLVPDEHSSVPLGEKFGATESDVGSLLDTCRELGLPVIGASFHCGSGNHDPASYATAIRIAHTALKQIILLQQNKDLSKSMNNHPEKFPWVLDIGGGYPGFDGLGGDDRRFCGNEEISQCYDTAIDGTKHKETALEIAKVVTPLIDELFPIENDSIRILSEPGRYFVESAFALCSRIYRVEQEGGDKRHYFIAQGVQGVFKDCLLCSETFYPVPLSLNRATENADNGATNKLILSTVHGPSGESYDVICSNYPLPLLNIGDWLIFDRVGAYTLSIAARNGRPPVRYVIKRSSIATIK